MAAFERLRDRLNEMGPTSRISKISAALPDPEGKADEASEIRASFLSRKAQLESPATIRKVYVVSASTLTLSLL